MFAPLTFVGLVFLAATSAPASAPSVERLGDTGITFVPPASWSQVAAARTGRTFAYRSPGGFAPGATIVVNVNVQDAPLRDRDAEKLAESLCQGIRDNAAKSGVESLDPPRVEKDDRFFVRIHHRFKKGDKVTDQLQLYRALGTGLVSVAVVAETDSADQAKFAFAVAEGVMLSASSSKQSRAGATAVPATRTALPPQLSAKATVLSAAKIQVPAPVGWHAKVNDGAASGIVVTCRDPADETNLIAVSVRQLPKEARSDPKLRDALVDDLAAGEQTQFKIDGSEPLGQTTAVTDRRFLRKSRTRYSSKDTRFDVCSRQIRVGDVVASVTLVCLNDQFETMDKFADQLALAIRPAGK